MPNTGIKQIEQMSIRVIKYFVLSLQSLPKKCNILISISVVTSRRPRWLSQMSDLMGQFHIMFINGILKCVELLNVFVRRLHHNSIPY